MSRIGKIPLSIPKGVKINVQGSQVLVEGPKGKLNLTIPLGIAVENKEEKIFVNRLSDTKQNRANHGTIRSILKNIFKGVTEGHKRNLEIQGVGFRAQVQGQKLTLNMGFSHSVELSIPQGLKVTAAKPTDIEIEGVDIALVGEFTANIRKVKPPEPYKGKGIRYSGEIVRRKQGKSVTK